ncbi:MAG: metallophosphoesterase [Alphaproteobacteria bacterium]|nr:metallophosphoesterase [Alphaproteobacteria bacterium]
MLGSWIVYTLIATPCIFYTGYALTAHTGCPMWLTAAVYVLLTAAWFAMALIWNLRSNTKVSPRVYTLIAHLGYFMLGFAFLLMCVLGLRDAVWLSAYLLTPFKVASPFEPVTLIPANLWTLGIVGCLSAYALFAAAKMPRVTHYHFTDSRIRRPLKILALSDLHINKTVSPAKVHKFVQYFNALQADVIVLAGDIADDFTQVIGAQLRELKKLQAPQGVYVALGNHEVYYNALQWEATFAALGWQVLHNSGVALENTGVYIGGVPSYAGFMPNPAQALRNAKIDEFRILAAHEPAIAHYPEVQRADVQVSGHTHGGQIFPFHLPVRWGNGGFVSGAYQLDGTMLLVSNGASYWGPPMRLLAPSDVLLLELEPQVNNF